MEKVKLKCTPLDDLLGGGIENGTITMIYGEAGSGKTNLCLQATREYAAKGRKVAFIDSEGVSLERLNQICEKDYDFKKVLDNILFFTPNSFENQEKTINDVINLENVDLLVIDTINLFYRINLEDDKDATMRSFLRQIANLQMAAREKNICVLIAEQVYTDKNGDIKPFTHRETDHMMKTVLKLEKNNQMGKRNAIIMKHRSQPEGKTSIFKITKDGLE
jgi:DNA repair protein RadB